MRYLNLCEMISDKEERTMNYMEEATKIIEELYGNNPVMKRALLDLNPDIISSLASVGQKGIDPEDVLAGTNGDPEALAYLRKKAEKQLAVRKLYALLCNAYAIKRKKEKTEKDEIDI